jgi:transposase
MSIKLQSQITHQKKLFKIYQTSPDLNPIDNLWKILKYAIQHGSICPKTTSDLRVVIAREW